MTEDRTPIPKDATEELLLEWAKEGHNGAFEALMTINMQDIVKAARKFVYQYGLPDSDYEDVVQIVLLNAWTNIGSFRGESKLSTWAFTIARNTALNLLDKQNRTPGARPRDIPEHEIGDGGFQDEGEGKYPLPPGLTDYEDPQSIFDGKVKVHEMMSYINRLPDELRITINLRQRDQLSYQEIATRTETNVNTVKTRIHRGRKYIDKMRQESNSKNLID